MTRPGLVQYVTRSAVSHSSQHVIRLSGPSSYRRGDIRFVQADLGRFCFVFPVGRAAHQLSCAAQYVVSGLRRTLPRVRAVHLIND